MPVEYRKIAIDTHRILLKVRLCLIDFTYDEFDTVFGYALKQYASLHFLLKRYSSIFFLGTGSSVYLKVSLK